MEAAGQLIHLFRGGLDYAFILVAQDAGRVIQLKTSWILVPAHPVSRASESMSLYRAGLRLALFLPLGVSMPPRGGEGFTDVSPVVTLPSRAEATVLIEPASASPTQSGLHA